MVRKLIITLTAVTMLASIGTVACAVVQADSGIAGCQEIAKDAKLEQLSRDRYRQIRAMFDGSSDAEIRDYGRTFVDTIWAMTGLEDDEMNNIFYTKMLSDSYAGLVGACFKSGVTLDPSAAAR